MDLLPILSFSRAERKNDLKNFSKRLY